MKRDTRRKSKTRKNKRINKKKRSYNRKTISMKGGSIDEFFRKMETEDGIVKIGKGGFGVVYLDKTQPSSVFKVSKESGTCKDWSKEAKIYERLNADNIDTDLCKMLKMKDYKTAAGVCCMELTRAINPRGPDVPYTILPHFRYDSNTLDAIKEGRGLFLGVQELIAENIFNPGNINRYMHELGILMARLHYRIKNDGYDLELFISKEEDKIIIYVGDFDRSEFYEEVDKERIDRLCWSFAAVEYFPGKGELYSIFSDSYLIESEKYGAREIAEKVLAEYLQWV